MFILLVLSNKAKTDKWLAPVTQQNLGVEANSNKTDCVQRKLYKAGYTQKRGTDYSLLYLCLSIAYQGVDNGKNNN